jgi:hypothetical protein
VANGKSTTAWQWTSNYSWWQRGDNSADNNNIKTTTNKCAAAEVEDNKGQKEATDEHQWHSRQAMANSGQWQRTMAAVLMEGQ